jgi:anhydro-N-acetylmuramic acid kinase
MTDYYIGLMSGTSLDGIDAVLVDFSNNIPLLIESHSHPFPEILQQELIDTIQPEWVGSLSTIGSLNQKLGKIFSEAVNKLIEKSSISNNQIKAIGSHGHTLWHQPSGKHPFSLQLGDGNLISELTGITTVADFRSRDIAAGGQGAPLVPAFHAEFLTHTSQDRIILNIGGIANITYLPSKTNNSTDVYGFDTGPGNGLIDAWVKKTNGDKYDKKGSWAKSGTIIPDLLKALLNEDYFSLSPPKSTGKEFFNLSWLESKLGEELTNIKAVDIQATLTALTAKTIAMSCINTTCKEVLVCGGGVHNDHLIKLLKNYLPDITISSSEVAGINPNWMEAIAFAWLAKQTIEGRSGNLPAVTGAKGSRILGAVYSQ